MSTAELYKKYRPTSMETVVGQSHAVSTLESMLAKKNIPHALLFSGPSGCGKTTFARILKTKLGCRNSDFIEMNCADVRGIDNVRDIASRMSLAALGKCRIYLLDEFHQTTKDAQTAFLKILEDTPSHVYFFIATTDPNKLLNTILTRCTEIRLKPVESADMTTLIQRVLKEEKQKLSEIVISSIVEAADGSPRKALVTLEQVLTQKAEEDQLNVILAADSRRQGIELARALVSLKTKWSDVAGLLKQLEGEPESIRHLVLSYAKSVMLNQREGPMLTRCYNIMRAFCGNFFDSKMPGLVTACFEVLCTE